MLVDELTLCLAIKYASHQFGFLHRLTLINNEIQSTPSFFSKFIKKFNSEANKDKSSSMLKKFLKWEFLAFSSSFCMGCRFKPFLNAFVWLIRMLYHRTKGEATDQDILNLIGPPIRLRLLGNKNLNTKPLSQNAILGQSCNIIQF